MTRLTKQDVVRLVTFVRREARLQPNAPVAHALYKLADAISKLSPKKNRDELDRLFIVLFGLDPLNLSRLTAMDGE